MRADIPEGDRRASIGVRSTLGRRIVMGTAVAHRFAFGVCPALIPRQPAVILGI
jgi:hypothetical protein